MTHTHSVSSKTRTASMCVMLLWFCYEFVHELHIPVVVASLALATNVWMVRWVMSYWYHHLHYISDIHHSHRGLTNCVSPVVVKKTAGNRFPPQTAKIIFMNQNFWFGNKRYRISYGNTFLFCKYPVRKWLIIVASHERDGVSNHR